MSIQINALFLCEPVNFQLRLAHHNHHFAPGMCFLVFLDPSRCYPHAGISRFLQPSRHLSQSCASNLCKPLAIMSHSSTSFHLFFGLSFFVPSASKCSAFTGPLFSSIRSTCPNHRNLCFLRKSIFLHPSFHESSHCFILSFKVFPHIIRNILISVVFNFLSSSTFNAQHSAS